MEHVLDFDPRPPARDEKCAMSGFYRYCEMCSRQLVLNVRTGLARVRKNGFCPQKKLHMISFFFVSGRLSVVTVTRRRISWTHAFCAVLHSRYSTPISTFSLVLEEFSALLRVSFYHTTLWYVCALPSSPPPPLRPGKQEATPKKARIPVACMPAVFMSLFWVFSCCVNSPKSVGVRAQNWKWRASR